MIAANSGNVEAVQALLDKGANVNVAEEISRPHTIQAQGS